MMKSRDGLIISDSGCSKCPPKTLKTRFEFFRIYDQSGNFVNTLMMVGQEGQKTCPRGGTHTLCVRARYNTEEEVTK